MERLGMALGRSLQSRFEVDALLGKGGLGDLYRVRPIGTDEPLALRLTDIPDAQPVLDAFGEVASLHERLSDVPLSRMRACGGDEGRAWYVSDHLDGESVLSLIRRRGPLPLGDAIDLVAHAIRSVAGLHARGVVYQDLNARNLFVAGADVYLLEIGVVPALARLLKERPGLFATPRARAAEQLVAVDPDPRTDVYALATVLYFVVTGRKAIPDAGNMLQLASTRGLKPPALHAVPEGLRPILARALALRPDDRFASADEFRDALAAVARSA
jgi:eukaryotic-like serine/threonine-protein kinase